MSVEYIRDYIDIPDRVMKGAYVLTLLEGETNPQQTVDQYVVTPQLAACFDDALNFIASALEEDQSKLAFLFGSFGSGKSHFMAILDLLLKNNANARGIQELHTVVKKHDALLAQKNLLMVPFHMIDAKGMEDALFGGYLRVMAQKHPQAPPPAVFRADGMFRDAVNLREKMRDEAFFAGLERSQIATDDDLDMDWSGGETVTWDAEAFEAALTAPADSKLRSDLVSDLVGAYFPNYKDVMGGDQRTWLSIDQGLAVISNHAKALGYHGIVLFLDELILWLASRRAERKVVMEESAKISKLREFINQRGVPVISFVACQPDLEQIIDDRAYGKEHEGQVSLFRSWSERYFNIKLADSNLPAIVKKRVLKLKPGKTRGPLYQAYENLKLTTDARMALRGAKGSDADMRELYPFSPALVNVLIELSSVLQRERTAIKVMVQMLCDRKADMKLGELLNLGDLFDAITVEADPFAADMRRQYNAARDLYHRRLLPMLEVEHQTTLDEIMAKPVEDPNRLRFRTDDLLLKSIILTALAPHAEAFLELTPARLAALNHGARTLGPKPAHHGHEVLKRVREWAAKIHEIRIADQTNHISCRLTGVDVEAIIDKARSVDDEGPRINKVRELIFAEMGIGGQELLGSHTVQVTWRGTVRNVHIVMENIRKLPFAAFESGHEWKLIFDFPFDEPGYTPNDDTNQVEKVREYLGSDQQRTLCWMPYHLKPDLMDNLGRLVKLDHILADSRFPSFTTHLNETDRAEAKSALDSQRNSLRQKVRNALYGAYGLANPDENQVHVLETHERIGSLCGVTVRPPASTNFNDAVEKLICVAYDQTYPDHPHFGQDIKKASLNHIMALVRDALYNADKRLVVPDKAKIRLMQDIAHALNLVDMGNTAFIVKEDWRRRFQKRIDELDGKATVKDLRGVCDGTFGLTPEVQDLLIIVFAEETHHGFKRMGAPHHPEIGKLPDDALLEGRDLPDQEVWDKASAAAAELFGIRLSPMVSVTAMETFAEVMAPALRLTTPARELVKALEKGMARLGLESAMRLETAREASGLLSRLQEAEPDEAVSLLAEVKPARGSTLAAMATSSEKADRVTNALNHTLWDVMENAWRLDKDEARNIREELATAFQKEELAQSLVDALREGQRRAAALLGSLGQQAATPTAPASPKPSTRPGAQHQQRTGLSVPEARKLLDQIEKQDGNVRIDLSWTVRS